MDIGVLLLYPLLFNNLFVHYFGEIMNREEYRNFLLNNIPRAKLASGGKEIQCRCFECSDSRDPRSYGHLYISIPDNDNTPSLYNCFKCNCRGVVTHQKLIEWNIYEESIAIELINHNKKCSFNPSNDKYFRRTVYKISNNSIKDSEISKIKLDYINNRLGTNLTFKDLMDLKIVLNLYDLLNSNKIHNLTRNKEIADQLDINFLGFISIDNAFLNMRRLCDQGQVFKAIDKRYINYKIFDKYDTSERFYTIPTKIDILSPDPIKLHIAEGPFDILSIYLNLRKGAPGIYSSCAGSNYENLIMYFLNTFKLPYVEIHIYPDNDESGSNYKMQQIATLLRPLGFSLFIHRNIKMGEKDFGVSIDKIQESVIRMI